MSGKARLGGAVMVARGMLTYVLVMFDTERQSGIGKKWFGGVRLGSQGWVRMVQVG